MLRHSANGSSEFFVSSYISLLSAVSNTSLLSAFALRLGSMRLHVTTGVRFFASGLVFLDQLQL